MSETEPPKSKISFINKLSDKTQILLSSKGVRTIQGRTMSVWRKHRKLCIALLLLLLCLAIFLIILFLTNLFRQKSSLDLNKDPFKSELTQIAATTQYVAPTFAPYMSPHPQTPKKNVRQIGGNLSQGYFSVSVPYDWQAAGISDHKEKNFILQLRKFDTKIQFIRPAIGQLVLQLNKDIQLEVTETLNTSVGSFQIHKAQPNPDFNFFVTQTKDTTQTAQTDFGLITIENNDASLDQEVKSILESLTVTAR